MEQDSNQGTDQAQGGEDQNQDLSTANGESLETSGEGSYKPFATGKEKFTIDGEDVEMDWEEAKKSIQLARASYKKFEEANGIRQSAQKSYQQMMELARTNPEGLLRVLNPNWQSGKSTAQSSGTQQDQRTTEDEQPWQSELERIKAENEEFRSKFESLELERERSALQTEFQEVEAKYPVFKDKLANNYLKSEYRKALKAGMDVTLDTVAFYVSQDIQKSKTEQVQAAQKNIQNRRAQAPISSQPAGGEGKKKGPDSFDELKRSFGM